MKKRNNKEMEYKMTCVTKTSRKEGESSVKDRERKRVGCYRQKVGHEKQLERERERRGKFAPS